MRTRPGRRAPPRSAGAAARARPRAARGRPRRAAAAAARPSPGAPAARRPRPPRTARMCRTWACAGCRVTPARTAARASRGCCRACVALFRAARPPGGTQRERRPGGGRALQGRAAGHGRPACAACRAGRSRETRTCHRIRPARRPRRRPARRPRCAPPGRSRRPPGPRRCPAGPPQAGQAARASAACMLRPRALLHGSGHGARCVPTQRTCMPSHWLVPAGARRA